MKRPSLALLRAGPATADAWILDKIALMIVPPLLVPIGISGFGWASPWAYLLPILGGVVWTRVHVTPRGSKLLRVWGVIPFRYRRLPTGGFSVVTGEDSDTAPTTFDHVSVVEDSDGYSAFDARRIAGWLSDQAERLQGTSGPSPGK